MSTLRFPFFLLIILYNFCACQAQTVQSTTEEQQLRKEMNRWMAPYRNERLIEFDQWIDWVENHLEDVWRHPVFKHIDAFYQQHREQYLRLRQTDLMRYQPAPDVLPGYELVPDFYSSNEDKDYTMEDMLELAQHIGNFRTLGVADTRFTSSILYGFVLEYLKAEKGLTFQQVTNKIIYGEIIFADPIGGNQWQITQVNRLYALKFKWDIGNNRSSKPELWVYTGKRQANGWLSNKFPKANTAVQQLYRDLNAFRWALYDQPDSEMPDSNKMVSTVPDKLTGFYQAHRADYIRLRNEELAKYPEPDETYGKAFSQDVPELREEFYSVVEQTRQGYKLSDVVAPYEVDGGQTVYRFYYMAMRYLKNFDEYALTSWIAGQDIYTKRIDKNIWEILFFYRKYAIRFRWNIATDELSDIQARTKT